jgi:hypothetical protein
MNYYSIEFFKYFLCIAIKSKNNKKILNKMLEYVKDREQNNKSAYSKKWMKKLDFSL